MDVLNNPFNALLAAPTIPLGTWLMAGTPATAEAMGCVGIRVDDESEVESAIDRANSINDRPVVVDFCVDSGEKVFPMVAAGQSNDDIMLQPSQNARREFLR